jgi:hypothetical protein
MAVRSKDCNYDEQSVFEKWWGGAELGCQMLGKGLGSGEPRIYDYDTWYKKIRCVEDENTSCR